jgi:hypothetical protein
MTTKFFKALFTVLFNLVMCFVIGLGLTMFIAKINPLDLPNMLFPQKDEITIIEAVERAVEWFIIDYDDCYNEMVCTLATALNPQESYVTPIFVSLGYSVEQTEFILTIIVDTFDIYMG